MVWTESEYSERTAMRLARAGALVRIVAEQGACEVCQAMASRVYTPAEVPRLPVRGCKNERCRCRFEAVDPETELTASQIVERGVHALRAGRGALAEKILRHAVSLDEMNEQGWLWLSAVVEGEEQVACLEKVLAINPANKNARAGLEAIQAEGAVSPSEPASPPVPAVEPVPVEAPPVEEATSALPDEAVSAVVETLLEAGPPELNRLRAERRVIVEQWREFIAIAVEIDPQMLLIQAQAFLGRLQRLNLETNETLSGDGIAPQMRLAELRVQWSESDEIGEALASVIDQHQAREGRGPGWQAMHDTLRQLGKEVLGHRELLRKEIEEAEDETPQ